MSVLLHRPMVSQRGQMGGHICLYKPLLSAISSESFPKRDDLLLTDFRKKTKKRSLPDHRSDEPSSDSCFGHTASDWASFPATKENISGGVCCKMLHHEYLALLHLWITFFKRIDPASRAPLFSTPFSHKPRRNKQWRCGAEQTGLSKLTSAHVPHVSLYPQRKDSQQPSSIASGSGLDSEVTQVLSKAVEELGLELSTLAEASHTSLMSGFLQPVPPAFFPEVHEELTKSWRGPYLVCVHSSVSSTLTVVDSAEQKVYDMITILQVLQAKLLHCTDESGPNSAAIRELCCAMCHFLLKWASAATTPGCPKSFLTQQRAKPVGAPAQPYPKAEPEPEVPTVALPTVEVPGSEPSLGDMIKQDFFNRKGCNYTLIMWVCRGSINLPCYTVPWPVVQPLVCNL